jgi:AraC-like DNA-binding protein
MNRPTEEWSRYYHDRELEGIEVLHARFVTHRYPRHAHEHGVIALVDRGAASYRYRGARQTAVQGQAFLINPGEPHTGDPAVADGYTYRVLYPTPEYLARVATDAGAMAWSGNFRGSVVDDPLLVSSLTAFHAGVEANASIARIEWFLLQALARLTTEHGETRVPIKSAGSEHSAVKRAREYLETHFAERISISKLASLTSLSPYYLARSFEKIVGLPPHAYLESVRVRKARGFLDQGYTLASAALLAGYADQSHFTHRFKSVLGITPGQYAGRHSGRPKSRRVV